MTIHANSNRHLRRYFRRPSLILMARYRTCRIGQIADTDGDSAGIYHGATSFFAIYSDGQHDCAHYRTRVVCYSVAYSLAEYLQLRRTFAQFSARCNRLGASL